MEPPAEGSGMRPEGDRDRGTGPDAERWHRVRQLFHEVVDRDEEEWPELLAPLPEEDRRLLAGLLAADRGETPILNRTPEETAEALMGAPEAHPDRIGPYKVLRSLGRGGMGQVLLGSRDDGSFHQDVAIKLVRRGMDSEDILGRFRAERQILATLNHPNIARLLDGGITSDGRSYFVMELVRGSPITDYCRAHDLPLEARLDLFVATCAAVLHANERGVIHRDLKPRNILVMEGPTPAEGTVKLLDFGIARVLDPGGLDLSGGRTRTGSRLMTPEYASPEQLRGGEVGAASDVYSLGVVLYELVTGARRPFEREGWDPAAAERVAGDPSPVRSGLRAARVPAALEATILMALREEPERRYASAGELGDDLRRFLRGRPVRARGDSLSYRARTFLRKRSMAMALLVALVGVGMGIAGLMLPRLDPVPPLRGGAPVDPLAVAVLPFEYSGPDGEEYLVGGLADGLDAHLASVPGLTVVGRGRSRDYREWNRPAAEIGAELGVAYILDGSVRFEGPTNPSGRVVITPRLIQVSDGRVVWSQTFDRTMVQFFPLQTTIATEIAETLGVDPTAVDWTVRGAAPTPDLEAWRLYLRGEYFRRYVEDEAWLRLAEAEFTRAVERDSTLAEAWAKLSTVHTRTWFYHYDRSDERLARALEAAERAIRHGPGLAEGHYAMGSFLYGVRRELPEAQEAFQRALELQPNHVLSLRGLASAQLQMGRTEEALAAFGRLAVIDPRDGSGIRALDAQPFFLSLDCIEGTDIRPTCRPVERWCPGAGGVVVGGACWFLGARGDGLGVDGPNCNEVCAAADLVYDGATRFFAGSDGTDENCIAVLRALDAPGFHGFQRTLGVPLGCGVSHDPNFSGHPDWIRVTGSSRTTAAARGGEGRACACRPAR
jgi:eukaryotic-like serine/threonine-protein kinase